MKAVRAAPGVPRDGEPYTVGRDVAITARPGRDAETTNDCRQTSRGGFALAIARCRGYVRVGREPTIVELSQYDVVDAGQVFMRVDFAAVAVESNHPERRGVAQWHGVPFHHVPISKVTKPQAEAKLARIMEQDRAELDEGPIMAQQVQEVDHTSQPEDLVAAGRDAEAKTLSTALRWHLREPGLPRTCRYSGGFRATGR